MAQTPKEDEREAHRRIIARLREQAEDVRRLCADLDEAARGKRTIPDKWSVKELVCHLARVQRVFEARLDRLLSEDSPEIVSYEPEGDAEFDRMAALPSDRSLRDFLSARERLLGRLEKLAPTEWRRAGSHPEYPRYDVHFAMEYLAHHEAHHIYQMFQRRAPLAPPPR